MSKRVKSHLRLTIVVVAMIVSAAGAYGAYRYLLNRRVVQWRHDGIAAARAGNHDAAATLLGKYLQRYPRDEEVLAAYITSRELAELPNGQHYALTIAALKMLVGLEPDRLADRKHLLELYFKLDARPEAIDTANAVLSRQPADLRALAVKTEVLQRMRQDREALLVAERWAAAAPADPQPHMAAFALRTRLGQPADAIIADALKLRDAHPDDAAFELLLGFAYIQAGDDTQAAQWLKAAAAHPNISDELAKTLITQFDALGMSQDALGVMEQRVKSGGGQDLRWTLAQRLWQLGKWDQVASMLGDMDLGDVRTDATLIAFRAIASANRGKTDDLERCRAALSGRTQAAARAWTLLLQQIVSAKAVDEKQVVVECGAALSIDPQNAYLRYFLGDAEARLGETDLAVRAWRFAIANNSSWGQPSVRLVEALLQKGRPEQAMDVASAVARHNPTNAAAVISLARAWAADLETGGVGRADDLLKLVSEIQKQLPGEERTLLIQLNLMIEHGRRDDAIHLAQLTMSRTPAPHEQFFSSLATMSLKFSLGLEEECYRRSEQVYGLTANLAYARAILQAIKGHAEDGLKLFDSLSAHAGKSEATDWRLAPARYLDINLMPQAKAAWVGVSDAFPRDLAVQRSVVAARAVSGDWTFMERAISRLRALTGDKGLDWRLARARLLVGAPRSDADCQDGSILLNDLIQEYPQLAETHVLLAHALVQMKRLDGAVEHLTLASQRDPTSVPIALQLSALLQSRGDFERVRQQLDRIMPQVRSPEQRRQAALLLAQQGSSDRAVELLAGVQPNQGEGPQDYQNDLLPAMLHRRRHELDKAEAVTRKLMEHPNVVVVQFAASFYASQGRGSEAEQALACLDSMKLEPGMRQLVRGSYYAEAGQIAAAAEHYQLATVDAPGNSVAWRVFAACQIAQGQVDQALMTLDQARRALPDDAAVAVLTKESSLLRAGGGDADLRTLVLSIIRNPLGDDTNLELLGILTQSSEITDSEMLIGRLQQLGERHPESAALQIHLAECYWNMGRQTAALATLRRAISAFPNDPEPAKAAVRLYAAAAQWSEMAAAAEIWKKRSVDQQLPDVALAQAQIGLGHQNAALAALAPYLPAAAAVPDQYADLLFTDAQALVSVGQQAQAVAAIRPLASAPDGRVRWLKLALACPDKDAAMAWLVALELSIPADDLQTRIGMAETVDRLGRRFNDPQLTSKASADLEHLAAASNATALALTAAGTQCDRCGDRTAAEGFYRRAIMLDAADWAAHNNLAMLLLSRGGDAREAMSLASVAVKLRPRLAQVHDTLAAAQAKTADYGAAAQSMRVAIGLEPDNASWRVHLAQYLLDGADVPAADKALNELETARLDLQSCPESIKEQLKQIRKRLARVARG